jgi:integrase
MIQAASPSFSPSLSQKYGGNGSLAHFNKWLTKRFGDWPFPKLFLAVKAHTGCRLMDLCSLKSSQLQPGRLIFPANLTKGRKERRVPMPNDLYGALNAFKGKTWLWEKYVSGLRAVLESKEHPTHQMIDEFSPQRLYHWIETVFADYRRLNKDRPALTTHMFRKRAFTMAWQAGVDVRHASIAYGCNVETLIRHYVALDEQQVTDDVFATMAAKVRGTIAEQMGNKRNLKPTKRA